MHLWNTDGRSMHSLHPTVCHLLLPRYQTTSSDIGALSPTVHTSHTQFHGRSQAFSNHLGKAGMPCNKSLNTYMDKGKV
jgi:hypothetical protein